MANLQIGVMKEFAQMCDGNPLSTALQPVRAKSLTIVFRGPEPRCIEATKRVRDMDAERERWNGVIGDDVDSLERWPEMPETPTDWMLESFRVIVLYEDSVKAMDTSNYQVAAMKRFMLECGQKDRGRR